MTSNMDGQNTGNEVQSSENGGNMTDTEKLASDLRAHKEAIKIPYEDLAHNIGIRAKTIYRLFHLNGKKMHPATIMAIENYLKTAKNGKAHAK